MANSPVRGFTGLPATPAVPAGPVSPAISRPVGGRRGTPSRVSRPVALLAGALAVILVLAVGTFAARSFFDGRVSGGADSPEAAVSQFMEAIERSDPIGLLWTLEPDLSSGLVATVERLQKVSADNGVTAPGRELDAFRVHFVGVTPTITKLNERVAAATFSGGTIQFTYDASKVPPGLASLLDDVKATERDITSVSADIGFSPTIMIVKQDGRWFRTRARSGPPTRAQQSTFPWSSRSAIARWDLMRAQLPPR